MARFKKVYVFDNGGETLDRYTGVISKTGDIIGFNDNPFHPMGFGQFCGNVTDRMNITFGYGWRRGHKEKTLKLIKNSELRTYIQCARDEKHLGKEVDFNSLPEEAKKYVLQCCE